MVFKKKADNMADRRDFLKAVSAGAIAAVMPPALADTIPLPGRLTGNVQVDANVVAHDIDLRIHGHFIEHIGRVVNHGLWAELLLNRKFYPVDPDNTQVADPWKPESNRTDISYVIDQIISLNGISSQRITLFGGNSEWRGISQAGFDVLRGHEYVAYAWVRSDSASRAVRFSLLTQSGEVLAQEQAALQRADWQKYEVRLQSTADTTNAIFNIGFNSPGINWIGAASLMPADNVSGMRRDVLEMFKLLAPTIFRWPGGCYADVYDWQKAIGPRDRRPPVPIIPLGYPDGYNHGMDPNDFGTDEFLELCKVMKAEPYINANFGMGTPELAAGWVEYCNGTEDSKWGSIRVANGHREPYAVKNWAIGNEVYGSPYESGNTTAEGYCTYYVPIARAMRKIDPNIRIIAVGAFGESPLEKSWNSKVLTAAGSEIDFLSFHHYYPAGFWPPQLKNRPLQQYLAVVAEPTRVKEQLSKVISAMDAVTSDWKKVQIAFDEWNELDWDYTLPGGPLNQEAIMNYFVDIVRKSSLEFNQNHRDGLYCARMMHNFMRFGDRLPIAVRTHPINSLATMRTDSTRVFMTAPGKMMQLYREHTGTRFVPVSSQAPAFDVPEQSWKNIPYLDALATWSQDGGKLFVHLLNLHPDEVMATRVRINGASVHAHGTAWHVAPEDFMACNDFGITNVDIGRAPLDNLSDEFVYNLPPHSATILEIEIQPRASAAQRGD